MKKLLSIVIPVFNEEKNIPVILKTLRQTLQPLLQNYDYEVIFINDGSRDNSLNILHQVALQNKNVKVISFSRNFGHQAALTAGMKYAQGNAVITMDCDLQDPPEVIIKMIKKWEKGNKIIYARRLKRSEGFFKKYTAIWYYKFLDQFSDVRIPRNVGDFRLIDRKVCQTIKKMPEKAKYLRGMVAWVGFKHAFVDFERPNRLFGITGYSLRKMMRLAMDGILNFSLLPLQLGFWLGMASIFSGMAMILYMIGDIIIYHTDYPLYKFLIVVLFILMGFLFMMIWILGEYIGRIYNEAKDRPLYVIEEKINLAKNK